MPGTTLCCEPYGPVLLMREVVSFADVEVTVVAYLLPLVTNRWPDADVGTARTTSSPVRFVRVERVGGLRVNLVTDEADVAIQCWAKSLDEAADLAKWTRAWVQAAYGEPVSGLSWDSELGGPVSFPDPDTDLPRYQHTQTVTVTARVE